MIDEIGSTLSTWQKGSSSLDTLGLCHIKRLCHCSRCRKSLALETRQHLAFKVEQPSVKNSKVAAEVGLLQKGSAIHSWTLVRNMWLDVPEDWTFDEIIPPTDEQASPSGVVGATSSSVSKRWSSSAATDFKAASKSFPAVSPVEFSSNPTSSKFLIQLA